MKIRTDFVTNSSSSSFIISTNEELEENYSIKKLSKENLPNIIEEFFDVYYFSSSYSDDELKKIFKLNDDQLIAMKMAEAGKLDDYIDLKKAMEGDENIYSISFDWNDNKSEYYNNIVRNSNIITEGD